MMAQSKNIIHNILKENFGGLFIKKLWSGNCECVLPIAHNFDLGSILPAIFYMFRFGERRGEGAFLKKFGGSEGTAAQKGKEATIERVAKALSYTEGFQGFKTRENILGDLLLSYTLENIKKERGRDKPIRYAAPMHYFASWLDLPFSVAHLRFVPEMLVSLLANQNGEFVKLTAKDKVEFSHFPVGRYLEHNPLLKPFIKGMVWDQRISNKKGDTYDEAVEVTIDELLTIRLGQYMENAPKKLSGKNGKISNQRPIAQKASEQFSEDLSRFIKTYADIIPKQNFLMLLESAISIGLTTIVSSTFHIMSHWLNTGKVLPIENQTPLPLFVDVSNGLNRELKKRAEISMQHFLSIAHLYPKAITAIKLLKYKIGHGHISRHFKSQMESLREKPYATDLINFLGTVLTSKHPYAYMVLERLDQDCDDLINSLEEEEFIDEYNIIKILRDEVILENPVKRLATVIVTLKRRFISQIYKVIDSSMFVNRPNGLLYKKRERSVILNHTVLEYLVHQVLLYQNPLTFQSFLNLLKVKYGFYIDEAPSGLEISYELLHQNRTLLEQRLRALGLMHDVNDAESMKTLEPYFHI